MAGGGVITWLVLNGWKVGLAIVLILLGLFGYALMCVAKGDDDK